MGANAVDDFYSRDQDHDTRRWLALGYGGKTADPKNWRYWSLDKGQGPWIIVAPRGFAEYKLVGKKPSRLSFKDEVIFEGTQWAAQWHALSHFYSVVVPTLQIPLSEKRGNPASVPADAQVPVPKPIQRIETSATVSTPVPPSPTSLHQRHTPLGTIGEHPWIGREFDRQQHRVLVLGESYYGRYEEPDLEHDAIWVERVLDGRISDPFFNLIPARLGFDLHEFWHQVIFTNLVIEPLAPDNSQRPTAAQMRAGEARLMALIVKHKVHGILSVGKTQAPNAQRVANQAGIAFATTNHPTGANNRMALPGRFTEENARDAWAHLQEQMRRQVSLD